MTKRIQGDVYKSGGCSLGVSPETGSVANKCMTYFEGLGLIDNTISYREISANNDICHIDEIYDTDNIVTLVTFYERVIKESAINQVDNGICYYEIPVLHKQSLPPASKCIFHCLSSNENNICLIDTNRSRVGQANYILVYITC